MTSATWKRTVDRFPTEWAMDYGDETALAVQPTTENENRRAGGPAESPTQATMGRPMGTAADVRPQRAAAVA